MKIVTICRGGNVRSVAAKMILSRYLKHEVIAIGADNTNNETKRLLFDWADRIVVMNLQFLKYLKLSFVSHREGDYIRDYTHKTILLDVGDDIWGDPFNEDLQLKIVRMLNSNNLFSSDIVKSHYINEDKVVRKIREYKEKILTRNLSDSAL